MMRGVDFMNFIKGAMLGMVAGTVVGVMNSNSLKDMVKKGKNKFKKMAKSYNV